MFALAHQLPSLPSWQTAITQLTSISSAVKGSHQDEEYKAFHYPPRNALTVGARQNSIEALGWSPLEALETYLRLRTFAEDWESPGMEVYDDL